MDFSTESLEMEKTEFSKKIVDDFVNSSVPVSPQDELVDVIHDSLTENVVILTYLALMVTGLFANGVIMKIIIFTPQLRQNPNNVLVLNLMISGLLMTLFCIPFTMISVIRFSWKFGWILCKLITSLQSCSILVCSTTIAIISIDRYVRVTNRHPVNFNDPHQARRHWTILVLETSVIWTISILASIPFAVYQKIGTRRDGSTSCSEKWPSSWFKTTFLILYFGVQFVFPFCILMVSSYKIRKYLEFSRRSSGGIPLDTFVHSRRTSAVDAVNEVTLNTASLNPGRVVVTESGNGSKNHVEIPSNEKASLKVGREIIRNQQVTRTLTAITSSFVFLWLPWNMFNTYIDNWPLDWTLPQIYLAFTITHIVAMVSVPLNAFLYGWNNPMIKVQVLAMMGKPPAH